MMSPSYTETPNGALGTWIWNTVNTDAGARPVTWIVIRSVRASLVTLTVADAFGRQPVATAPVERTILNVRSAVAGDTWPLTPPKIAVDPIPRVVMAPISATIAPRRFIEPVLLASRGSPERHAGCQVASRSPNTNFRSSPERSLRMLSAWATQTMQTAANP